MKSIFYIVSTLIILLTSCAGNKLPFDKMSFYTGNGSLPPQYQEHLTITLDSVQGVAAHQKGENRSNSAFTISLANYKKLAKIAKGFAPADKKLGEFAVGGAINRVELFKGDSTVYSLTYQQQHKVGAAIKKFEKNIQELAPKMGLPMPQHDEQKEGGE